MRRIVFLLVVGALVGGFVLGRTTEGERASETSVMERGDVLRYPGAAVRCEATQEGGAASLLCRSAQLDVVFFAEELLVYRAGEPDLPVFAARR